MDSGEIVELSPYQFIDPPYQLELRQLLIYALAKSGVKVRAPQRLQVLEEQMRPHTLTEVEGLEMRFKEALKELDELKKKLK
jgi:hypothetical protein